MVCVNQDFGEREAEQAGTSGLSASAGESFWIFFLHDTPRTGCELQLQPNPEVPTTMSGRREEEREGRKQASQSKLSPQRARK